MARGGEGGSGPGPLTVAGAIATWLAIALGLHAAAMNKLSDVEGEVRTSRIIMEHRLTALEVKVDGLAGKGSRRLAAGQDRSAWAFVSTE